MLSVVSRTQWCWQTQQLFYSRIFRGPDVLTTTPPQYFICLVKSLHGLIIIRSEFRKKYLTFHHVSPKNLVFFIWVSFIIALVSLLRSCALVFALRPLGFCQELDARSYCDHSFKLDFPSAVCQPAPVKVFIVV